MGFINIAFAQFNPIATKAIHNQESSFEWIPNSDDHLYLSACGDCNNQRLGIDYLPFNMEKSWVEGHTIGKIKIDEKHILYIWTTGDGFVSGRVVGYIYDLESKDVINEIVLAEYEDMGLAEGIVNSELADYNQDGRLDIITYYFNYCSNCEGDDTNAYTAVLLSWGGNSFEIIKTTDDQEESLLGGF